MGKEGEGHGEEFVFIQRVEEEATEKISAGDFILQVCILSKITLAAIWRTRSEWETKGC